MTMSDSEKAQAARASWLGQARGATEFKALDCSSSSCSLPVQGQPASGLWQLSSSCQGSGQVCAWHSTMMLAWVCKLPNDIQVRIINLNLTGSTVSTVSDWQLEVIRAVWAWAWGLCQWLGQQWHSGLNWPWHKSLKVAIINAKHCCTSMCHKHSDSVLWHQVLPVQWLLWLATGY